MLAPSGLLLFAFIVFINSVKAEDHEKVAPEVAPKAASAAGAPRGYYSGFDCSMDGQWCLFDSNCCSNRCGWDFHCKNPYEDLGVCVPDYGRCIENQQCCSGECYGGYICIPWGAYYRDRLGGVARARPGTIPNARPNPPAQG